MRRALILLSVGTTVWFGVSSAHAMGFGKTVSPTLLGQTLDFSASVHLAPDEALGRECVSAEVQSGDNRVGAEQVRVSVQVGSDPNERIVRVTTSRMIEEPVVSVTLTVGCGSRVSRKFVTFLDPPLVDLAQASEAQAARAEPQRLDSQVAPLVALLQPPRAGAAADAAPDAGRSPAANRARKRNRNQAAPAPRGAHSVRLAAADQATTPRERRPAGAMRSGSAKVASAGPRLQLEAASPRLAQAPVAAASAVATAATPEPTLEQAARDLAGVQLQAQLTQERERIQALETGLAQLRSDAQSMQQSVLVLQARLRQAEGERYANPLVYVLGGLCALLAATTAVAWRGARRAGASRWWDLTQQAPARAPVPSSAAVSSVAAPPTPPVDDLTDDLPWVYQPPHLAALPMRAIPAASSPTPIGGLEVTTVIDYSLVARIAAGDPPAAPAPEPLTSAHELSMEDLIDLEQQAEFFLVLGQDEAAIELLSRHLKGGAGVSPLPSFTLLEIHRRRGDEAAYARVADAFHQRFGAYAPTWEAAADQGRTLEDYPQTITRLQQLWATPAEAMQALDAWLFRRQRADDTYDFGAYRELLFLYSIARELAEAAGGDGIDLLLPLEPSAVDVELPDDVTPSQFAALYAHPGRSARLDLDISMPAPLDFDSIERNSNLRQAL